MLPGRSKSKKNILTLGMSQTECYRATRLLATRSAVEYSIARYRGASNSFEIYVTR